MARQALDRFPAISLQGLRRAGKSTLALEIVRDRPHAAVSLDDDETRATARRDPAALFGPVRAGQVMVIDEIQREPDLVLAVKAQVDRARRPGQFVLTGSSDFLSLPQIPDSLAGRAVTIRLRPFSQGEIAGRREDFVSRLLAGLDEVPQVTSDWGRPEYAQAAWRGGFPEALNLEGPWPAVWLDSYVDRLVSRDAQAISERISPQRLRAVLRLLAANQAGELVKARVAEQADISSHSVTACLDLLETLFLVEALPPFSANLTQRQIGRPKTVVSDPGLALRLSKISRDQLLADRGGDWIGRTLEGLVTTELLKQRSWSDTRWELSHYRDRDGLEVDAVVELEDGKVILIEVKAASGYRGEHFAAMDKLAARLGDRFVAGVVLAAADHGWRYSQRLVGLPISALWQDW
jgi:predicted AAA+ superfamily ATPase